MSPYIICHMLSSLDGKIDGAALNGVTMTGEYGCMGPSAAERANGARPLRRRAHLRFQGEERPLLTLGFQFFPQMEVTR